MSRAQALMIGVGGDLLSLPGRSVIRAGVAGTLTATFRLDTDGLQYANTDATTNATTSKGYWVTPGGNSGNYECNATLSSGTLSTGTTGSWLALSSARSWTVSATSAGTDTASISVAIRRTGTTNTLVTGTINLEVDYS